MELRNKLKTMNDQLMAEKGTLSKIHCSKEMELVKLRREKEDFENRLIQQQEEIAILREKSDCSLLKIDILRTDSLSATKNIFEDSKIR